MMIIYSQFERRFDGFGIFACDLETFLQVFTHSECILFLHFASFGLMSILGFEERSFLLFDDQERWNAGEIEASIGVL